jgi:hypothetical protein
MDGAIILQTTTLKDLIQRIEVGGHKPFNGDVEKLIVSGRSILILNLYSILVIAASNTGSVVPNLKIVGTINQTN